MTVDALVARELAGLRVLLVEDDVDSREMLRDLMTMVGVEVREAADGVDALAAFDRERPDVIVSDLNMPRMDGLELVRRVRARSAEDGGLTPAIAVTAGLDDEQRTLLAGYHVYFAKPVDPMAILRCLASFAEAKREHGEEHATASWTVVERRPGEVVITLQGYIRAATIRATTRALLAHLERGPVTILDDVRGVTGFDPAVPSVGERALWARRDRMQRLTVIGGTRLVRLVSRAACAVLGVPFAVADDLPR